MAYRIVSSLVKSRGYYNVKGRVYDDVSETYVKHFQRSTKLPVKDNYRKALEMKRKIDDKILAEVIRDGPHSLSHAPTMEEYINIWLEKKSRTAKENTMEGYRQYARDHIIPAIGNVRVENVTVDLLQRYYDRKHETLSVNSLKKQHCVVTGALLEAIRDGLINHNPADYVEFPKAEKFTGASYTPEQLAVLLEGARRVGEPLYAAVLLASCYGLRRSECLGLRWKDVDFENSQIHVCNTVVKGKGGQSLECEQTKTSKSNRLITLIPVTVPYLKGLKRQHARSFLTLDKVVRWPDGRPVRTDYLTDATSRLMERCNLPHIRLHDLRATAATLLSTVAQPKQVQEFMGHEDVSTTLNIYTHVQRKERNKTSEQMNEILESPIFCSAFCSALEE